MSFVDTVGSSPAACSSCSLTAFVHVLGQKKGKTVRLSFFPLTKIVDRYLVNSEVLGFYHFTYIPTRYKWVNWIVFHLTVVPE